MKKSQAQMNISQKLPTGWRWARLGEVCEFESGRFLSRSLINIYGPVPVFGANGIIGYTSESCFQEPRIVIGRVGSCGAINKTEGSAWITDNTIVCNPNEGNDLNYIVSFLKTVDFNSLRTASIQPLITQTNLKGLLIPLPFLSEQKRIADILSEQMATVDRARAAAEAQLEAAKVLPAAYLREEFEGLEAQKWVKIEIQDCCQLLSSKSIATDGDTEVDVVTTACLTESGFQPHGIKRGKMWSRDAAECIIQPEEILIARSNTPELVGRVAMYPGGHREIVAADLTIRLMTGENVDSAYLSFYLSYLYLSGYWKTRAGGASGSMKKITRAQILGEKVPLPPLDEQRCIAASIVEKMKNAHLARKVLEDHLNEINKLSAALLRRAFNGEL